MDVSQFSVHVLRCPFGIRELRFTSAERSPASSVLPADPHYAHVTGSRDDNEGLLRSYAVAGTRGIQQLVATTRGAHAASDTTSAPAEATTGGHHGNGAPVAGTATLHADLFSIHDKGRLMMWDSDAGRLVASHAFHPAFTVHQCAAAGSCIYTTLEGSPDTTGAEEETCVYVWNRTTLQPVTVLRGHEGRLTALAVAPPSASAAAGEQSAVLLATASLDGTLRLWRHRIGSRQGGASDKSPVQVLAVLPTTELGFLNGLSFLSADVLVAACSKCALAFLRIPAATPTFGETLKWQLVRSPVDPDGSTTALHVCPFSPFDTRRTTNTGAALTLLQPSSPVSDTRRRKNIVTGSTSGYTQEWSIEIADGADSVPASPDETTAPASPLVVAAAGVVVRGRWHHKAHAATVGCIVTDEDVAVTTSIFDGARLYHRRAGATCVITTASMVPVLVPQVKQLVWGSVDGTLSVASYALFAAGTERQLQLLWTARPHNAAVRGVCLSLTPGLQWKALCVGAADGSVSVWRPTSAASAATGPAVSGKPSAAEFGQVLDMHVSASSSPWVTVVGLRREGRSYVLAVAEMDATSGSTRSYNTLPLPAQTTGGPADAVTCARLCCGAETSHHLCLLVGTRGGQLLCTTKEAKQGVWRPLQPCAWTAAGSGQRATISAVSPLLTVPSLGTLMAVVSYGTVSASLTTQRVLISVLHAHAEKGFLVVDKTSRWEGFVDVSAPTRSGVVTGLPNDSGEPVFSVEWLMPPPPLPGAASSTAGVRKRSAAGAAVPGVVVRDSRGMLIRCKSAADDGNEPAGKPQSPQPWSTPELLLRPSTFADRSSPSVTATLDGHRTDVLVSDGAASDVASLNIATNRKRVLLKASERRDDVSSIACDVGNAAVRLAAVRVGGGAATLCEVSLYDDKGQEQYRVTRSGAVVSCTTADPSVLKKQVSLAPALHTSPAQVSSARSPSPSPSTVCTLLAASADDRVIFVGYHDGLFQMVDAAGMFVFQRMWIADETGTARAIRDVYYNRGVVLVRLANDCVRAVVVPARSILDQPMSSK